jgi:hypothetical protein
MPPLTSAFPHGDKTIQPLRVPSVYLEALNDMARRNHWYLGQEVGLSWG